MKLREVLKQVPVWAIYSLVVFVCIINELNVHNAVIYTILIPCLIICSFVDYRKYIIPNVIIYPSIAMVLTVMASGNGIELTSRFTGFLFGLLLFLGIYYIGIKVMKREVIGGGDIKVVALVGLSVGIKVFIVSLLFTSILMLLVVLLLVVKRVQVSKLVVPYAPYLTIGTIGSIFCGNQLINWYMSFI